MRPTKRQRTGAGGEKGQLFLKIVPQPKEFVFCDLWYELSVFVMDAGEQLRCGMRTELSCDLLYDETPAVRVAKEGILVVDDSTP